MSVSKKNVSTLKYFKKITYVCEYAIDSAGVIV